MAKIENSTIIKHATPIAQILRKRGENWTAEAMAAVLVKTILEESGNVEALGDDFKADRQAWIALAKPFITAAKNTQNTLLCNTIGTDGLPLMPKCEATAKVEVAEFA